MTIASDIDDQITAINGAITRVKSAAQTMDPHSGPFHDLFQAAQDLNGVRTKLDALKSQVSAAIQAGTTGTTVPPPNGTTTRDDKNQVWVKAGVVGMIAIGAFALGGTGGYVLKGVLDKGKKKSASEARELPAAAEPDEEEEEEEEEDEE